MEQGTVFIGTVVGIQNPTPKDLRTSFPRKAPKYTFRVEEWFAGHEAATVEVESGYGGGDCGYLFENGATYVVFAYEHQRRLGTGICSRTGPIESSEALVRQLRARKQKKAVASLFGQLARAVPSLDAESYQPPVPLPRMPVRLTSGNTIYSSETDEGGIYSFFDVPAGTYIVSAGLPTTLTLDWERPLPLPNAACHELNLLALPNNQVTGQLVPDDGLPVRGTVELVPAVRYVPGGRNQGYWKITDEEGRYKFRHVVPGEYILVFNDDDERDPSERYGRTYFPGVREFGGAQPISIKEDTGTIAADILLRSPAPTREIAINLLWQDGNIPVEDAYIEVEPSSFPVETAPGKFRVRIFLDVKYTFKPATWFCDVKGSAQEFTGREAPPEFTLFLPGKPCEESAMEAK